MSLSTYSGRVRFALDVKNLRYTKRTHTPGLTDWQIKRIAGRVMVPTLVDGRQVVQGSDEILNYLESKKPEPNLLGENEAERKAIDRYVQVMRDITPDLRTDIVVRTRADLAAYSKETSLGAMPEFLRVPAARFVLDRFSRKWSCDEAGIASVRDRIRTTLQSLAPQLRPGHYLVGDRLTDADISICELTLLFRPAADRWLKAGPNTRRVYHAGWLASDVAYSFEVWRDALYEKHRRPQSGG
jgi:glutathione S-transferase